MSNVNSVNAAKATETAKKSNAGKSKAQGTGNSQGKGKAQNTAPQGANEKTSTTKKGNIKTVTTDPATGRETVTITDPKTGNKKKETTTEKNGTQRTTKYDDNGAPKSSTTTTKDKDGNVKKQTTEKYDEDGNITKKVTEKADGTKTVTKYDQNGNITTKAVTNEKTGEKKKTTYEYDENGDNTKKVTTNLKTGKTTTTTYEYDNKEIVSSHSDVTNKDGVVVKQVDTTYENGLKKEKIVSAPITNDDGEIIDKIQLSRTEYEYTEDGNLQSTQTTKANGDVKTTKYDTVTGKKIKSKTQDSRGFTTEEEKYDAEGKKISRQIYSLDENGAVNGTTIYTYNQFGELNTRTTKNAIGVPTGYSEYKHNEDGLMTRVDYSSDGTVKGSKEFYYDIEGRVTKEEYKDQNGEVKATTEYTYSEAGVKESSKKTDADGKPVREVTYEPNGLKATEVEYQYNADNTLASTTTTIYKATVGNIDGKGSNGISQVIERDAEGNTISEINYELNELGQPVSAQGTDQNGEFTAKYEYDNNNRLVKETKTQADGLESAKLYEYIGNTTIVAKETHIDDAGNETVILERELKTEKQGVSSTVQTCTETKLNEDGTRSTQEVQFKNGKLVSVSTDKDNDGNFEQVNQYNKKEQLSGVFTDENDDGSIDKYQIIKNGEVTKSYSYEITKKGYIKTSVDENADGKTDYVTYSKENDKGQISKMRFDFDNDGKIDQVQKFEYDEQGNMIGRYTDFDNDGKYDLFETIKDGKVVFQKGLSKRINNTKTF